MKFQKNRKKSTVATLGPRNNFCRIYLLPSSVSLFVLLGVNRRPVCIATFGILAARITLGRRRLVLGVVVVFRKEKKSVRSASEPCQVLALKSGLNHVPDRFHFSLDHFRSCDR
jgi:hypothetical protein